MALVISFCVIFITWASVNGYSLTSLPRGLMVAYNKRAKDNEINAFTFLTMQFHKTRVSIRHHFLLIEVS